MCETCNIADHFFLIYSGRKTADDVLARYFTIRIHKAMDLSTPEGFDQAVAELAIELGRVTGATDEEAMRAAVAVLDVDWYNTTAVQRRTLVDQAVAEAGLVTARIPQQIAVPFGEAADEVIDATREHARDAYRLQIGADFNALDSRITNYLVSSQTNFVTDEYGRRLDQLSVEARRVVAQGLEAGLGNQDIAAELQRTAEQVFVTRSPFYWEVVSGSFVADGRSFGQMSAFAEAGIQRYVIEAVLDENTTNTCRFLHGKEFEVADALRRFERIEALESPEDIKAEHPWVREAIDPESGRKVLYIDQNGARTPIAVVSRPATGSRDDTGEFTRGRTEQELTDLGLSFPPFHALCRTTVLPR